MKLLYASTIDLPSTRANRLQVLAMARALYKLLGEDFMLGLRDANGTLPDVPHIEVGYGRSMALAWRYARYARRHAISHIYCRDERLLIFLMLFCGPARVRPSFIYEVHHLRGIFLQKLLARRADRVVVITAGLQRGFIVLGCKAERVLVAPDAVDRMFAAVPADKQAARRALGLPQDKRLAVYAGSIDEPWKGVGTLNAAAGYLGDAYEVVIVGGKPHYVEEFLTIYPRQKNVRLEGHRPHTEIPQYLQAADVLVLPNSGKQEISRSWTSPLKLFEYMAAGRPIVASDLPSVREVVDDTLAILVPPDNAAALARGIEAACSDQEASATMARRAREAAGRLTWDNRAKAVADFIV